LGIVANPSTLIKNNMKILSIAPQPFFTPRGTPFSVYYRTLMSSELGHEVDILTYGQGQEVDIPGVSIIRTPAFNFLGEIKIGPSGLKLFYDFFLIIWTLVLLMRKKYDIVHAHEEAIFFCIFLKPFFKFKLIYDMHSSLPQQLTNFNFSSSKTMIKIFEKLEKLSIEKSEAVITICPDLADYVNRVISDASKHVMIENSIFDPVKLRQTGYCNDCTSASGIDESEISHWLKQHAGVVYAGTLEAYQGIDLLIDSFKTVISKEPDARLLIIGGTADQVEKYSAKAAAVGIGSFVAFTGRVPQRIAQALTKIARVQVSPRCAGTNTPLKIYEQLANGIPLVATNIYSHTQAIDSQVAFLVEPTPSQMAHGILEALGSENKRISKVKNALALYEREYSREAYQKKLQKVLNQMHELVHSRNLPKSMPLVRKLREG
jgi:glycosyltransferase involved in cell wall biosynthesis